MTSLGARVSLALLFAISLTLHGLRKKSLSRSGATAAFLVGFLSFASATRFGLTLLAFYLSATRATRYKSNLKKQIEDGYTSPSGNRSAKQVFASSLPAVILGVIYFLQYRYDAPISPVFHAKSCLNLSYLLFFAACAGDTFSSEIGIAMPGQGKNPVLILAPWREVPRGTNGGVTLEGTLASVFGGFVVGSAHFLAGPERSFSQLWLVVVGISGGLIGSVFDSILGMLFQASWLDPSSGRILKEAPNSGDSKFDHICGRNILSGETVNALAAVFTAMLSPLFIPLFRVDLSQL